MTTPMTGDAPDPNLLGSTAPPPDVSNAYSAQLAPQDQPQQQQSQGPTGARDPGMSIPPHVAHSAMIGNTLKNIAQSLEGQQTSYIPDPITGEVKEVPVQRKPGAFFRDLLLGAAVGGAQAAQLPRGSGALAGAATGFAGAQQNQRALQEQQAQQQKAEAFGKAQRAKAENEKQQAKQDAASKALALAQQTVAMHTHSTIVHDADSNLNTEDQLNSYSQGNQILLDKVAGRAVGVDLVADGKNINGTTGNGRKLFELVQKDPSIMQSADPDTFHRMDFMTYDKAAMSKDGVHQINDKWVDSNGKAVDMEDYAKHDIRDVPTSVWGEQMDMPNKDWNAVSGQKIMQGDDSAVSHGTFGQAVALNARGASKQNQDIAQKHAPPENAAQALQWQSLRDDLRRRAALSKTDPNAEKIDPDEMKEAEEKGAKADIFLKNMNDQKKTQETDAQFAKKGEFPTFGAPEKAAEYASQAHAQLQAHPEASPEQKAIWQEAADYGDKMEKTINTSVSRTASLRTAAEEAQRNKLAPVDPSLRGANGLITDDQKRFQNLPTNIQRQLTNYPSAEVSSLFTMADGDLPDTTFTQNPRKGTPGIPRDMATGLAHDINPYWTPTLFRDKQILRQQYETTKSTETGGKLFAFNNFMQHAKDLAEVSQKWQNQRSATGVPYAQMALKDLRKNLKGDPLLTQLEAAMSAPTKEYMNVLNQGHAEQGLDREKMDEIFNENSSPQQIVRGLKQYVGVAVDQLDGLDQPWRTLTGGSYPNLISPNAKQAAGMFGYAQQVAPFGSGGRITRQSTNQTPEPNQNALTHTGTRNGEKIGWDGKNWVNAQTRKNATGWNGTSWETK